MANNVTGNLSFKQFYLGRWVVGTVSRLAGWRDGLYSSVAPLGKVVAIWKCIAVCSMTQLLLSEGTNYIPPPSQKKTMLIVLSVLSVLCRPSSLFGSQQLSVLGRSCAIALVWALGLPWGVWVLQHKTVNPPESWWLLIRYSHPASCPEENSSGLHSLSLPHHPPLPIHSCTPTSPHADVTTYSILCRIQAQLLAFFFSPLSSTNISPPPFVYLAVWLLSSLPLLLSPHPLSLPLMCHFLPVTLPCFTPLFLF